MSIKEEVDKLISTPSANHKRLIEYVVRQLGVGRSLDEVLEDPYVINRAGTLDRRALLEEPEVIEAAGDDMLQRMRSELETALGA